MVSMMTENNLVVTEQKKFESRNDFNAIYPRKSGVKKNYHVVSIPKYSDQTFPFVVDWQVPKLHQRKTDKSNSSIKGKYCKSLPYI